MIKRQSAGGIGILLGLGCAFMFSISSLIAKKLNSNFRLHSILLACMRQTLVLLFAAPQVAFCKASYIGDRVDWPFLVIRSICGGISISCTFLAFSYLPLPDAGVIIATGPTFTTLFGRIFLKEKCRFSDIPVLFLVLCGVFLILRPPFVFKHIAPDIIDEVSPDNRLKGSLFAISAAIIQSGVYISFRKLQKANYATISFTYGLISAPILWIIVLAMGVFQLPPCHVERTMGIGIGLAAAVAQALLTSSSKFVPAGITNLLRSTETVFNFVWHVTLLDGRLNPFSVCGCIIVSFAISFLSVRTIVLNRYKDAKARQATKSRFVKFLLLVFQ